MVNRSGNIGRRGEHAAVAALKRVFPNVNREDVSKQHETKDLAHTDEWIVQVKARKTWNIKDVVNHMETLATEPWMIVYMDSDRRRKSNPKQLYAIMPLQVAIDLIEAKKEK